MSVLMSADPFRNAARPSRGRRLLCSGLVLSTAMAAGLASLGTSHAQTAAAGPIELDAVTLESGEGGMSGGGITAEGVVAKASVSATKTDTRLIEVPQAVSTVTQAQLSLRNPQSLLDAISYVPGVRADAFGFDPRYDSFTIRGFDATLDGIFRDGLRQRNGGNAYFKTEPYGLEGVSILKGPSGAVYGASGSGGIVDLRSKRPTSAPLREVEVEVGDHHRYQGNFDVSGPANADGTLLYRFTGLYRDADTEVMAAPDDRLYLAPALTFSPDADTSLTLLGEIMDFKNGGTVAYVNEANRVTDLFYGDPSFNDFDQTQGRIGYEFEHRFDETFTVRQNLRYSRMESRLEYVYPFGLPSLQTDGLLERGSGVVENVVDDFTVDNQLQATFDTGPLRHKALFGVDAALFRLEDRQGFGSAFPLDLVTRNYGSEDIADPVLTQGLDQDLKTAGIYMQDQVKFDRFVLTLGGRHDWASQDSTSIDLTSGDGDTLEQSDSQFTGRIGLTYVTDFGIAPYVSYGTSFVPNAGAGADGTPFQPTTAEQAEIGVKYEIPGRNATVTASLFDITQENGLFYDVVNGFNQQVQRGEIRSRGFELEGAATLDDGLSLIASYAYLDFEIMEGAEGTLGNQASSQPHHQASLYADYTVQSGPAEGLGLGAGVRYVSESFGDDLNSFENDARALVDASLRYDLGALGEGLDGAKLQINARNLFDEQKQTCTSGFCYLDQGRQVIGSLSYRF